MFHFYIKQCPGGGLTDPVVLRVSFLAVSNNARYNVCVCFPKPIYSSTSSGENSSRSLTLGVGTGECAVSRESFDWEVRVPRGTSTVT